VLGAISVGLESDCIDRGIHFGQPNYALDKLFKFVALLQIDRLEAYIPGVFQP
jgi:hypothetical protein